jgi:transcriptional regulator with XRE-family HTH domain
MNGAHVKSSESPWGTRLRAVRESRGLSRNRLAEMAGLTNTTIWRIEKGEIDARPASRIRILRALGFSDEDSFLNPSTQTQTLVVGTKVWNSDGRVDDLRSSEARLLPVYRWGACGDPRKQEIAPDPESLEYPPLGKENLIGPHGFAVHVNGRSMINRKIDDGDIVWVNPDKPPRIGRIVCARVWSLDGTDCGIVIKVLKSSAEGELWGDGEGDFGANPVLGSRFEILGPVVWIQPRGYPPD